MTPNPINRSQRLTNADSGRTPPLSPVLAGQGIRLEGNPVRPTIHVTGVVRSLAMGTTGVGSVNWQDGDVTLTMPSFGVGAPAQVQSASFGGSAGGTGTFADAGHIHAGPATSGLSPSAVGSSPSAGATNAYADAGHVHQGVSQITLNGVTQSGAVTISAVGSVSAGSGNISIGGTSGAPTVDLGSSPTVSGTFTAGSLTTGGTLTAAGLHFTGGTSGSAVGGGTTVPAGCQAFLTVQVGGNNYNIPLY